MNQENIKANIEAEQSVLGGLLLRPDSWDSVVDLVAERDFYRAEHQLIFRHIARIVETGRQLDVITLAESIESTGKLDKVGGLEYISSLVENTPSAANITSYAKIVHDHRQERDFSEAAVDISTIAESQEDIATKIEKAAEVLNRITTDSKSCFARLSDATVLAINSVEHRMASPDGISGLKTGFSDFDHKTCGLQNGDLIIIAGRPSMGKSAFAVNIAENVAINQGLPAIVFSLEMSNEQLALRSMSSMGMVNLGRLRSGHLQDDDWPRLTNAMSKIQDAPLYIDQSPMINVSQMHARAKKLKRQEGLALVVIDYLQLMESSGNTRNEELSGITRRLKLMAKDLNVPVILLSQLNRKLEERANKRPLLSDLRESGAIEQDADLVVMLYRDEYYNQDSPNKGIAEAIIQKQRMGEVGTVRLTFRGEFSRFDNFAGHYVESRPRQTRGFDGKNTAGDWRSGDE